MLKFNYTCLGLILLLLYSCKKEKSNTTIPADNIKLTLISGNNQSSPIGYPTTDSIVIKVTNNGEPVSNYDVQLIGSGCNQDLVTDVFSKADGTIKYLWYLASNVGNQTLNAVLINQNKRIDSITVNANALSLAGFTPRSACTPNPAGSAQRIIKLSTGRLIACFPVKTSLRYSDDNGISWLPFKSFGVSHTIEYIAATPQDEIFLTTLNEGVFYSKDAGNTWVDITPATFNKQDYIQDIAYTINSKLIFTGLSKDIYISADKGTTWTSSGTGLPPQVGFQYPVELKNGDIYILGLSGILYKSSDDGISWTPQNAQNEHITSLYVDANAWFYKCSLLETANGGIYISKDNGSTFNPFVAFTRPTFQPYVTAMGYQSDGYFYYGELSYSIAKIFNSNLIVDGFVLTDVAFPAYVVANNGNFLYTNNNGIYY